MRKGLQEAPASQRDVQWVAVAGAVVLVLSLLQDRALGWAALNSLALAAVFGLWGRSAYRVARERKGWERTAWLWFSAAGWALTFQVVAYFVVNALAAQAIPDWGARQAAPVAAYPLLVVGFLHLARRDGGRTVLIRALDAALVAGGTFFVLWSSVFRDLFVSSPLVLDERLEVMAYPTLGAALVATAWLVLGRAALASRGYRLAAYAVSVPLATDVVDSVLELGGNPNGAIVGDLGFVVGGLLWVLAARATQREAAWTDTTNVRSQLIEAYFPLGILALAVGTAIQTVNEHGEISLLQFWLAIGLILLLLVRMGVTLAQNMRLESELRSESAFKTQLLRFISHEVANPISPLRVQAKLLRAGSRPENERAWDIVERSIERLLSLSQDVREMALAETQRLVTEVVVEDAGKQVAAAGQAATSLAQQRGLELVLHTPLEPLPVRMDVQRFGQVLDNLLSNALKFTHAPGRITVRVERAGPNARVQVTDTGIGLSASDRDGLFQPFRRAQDGAAPGLGLGLYLCKAIMTELHGAIGVDSPGRGQGTTFWVTLPLEGNDLDPLPLGRTGTAPPRVEPAPTATVKLA